MTRDHMRHLVREHRGQFRVVIGERNEAARDVERSARQREGIDRGRVQQRHAVFDVGPLGGGDETIDDLGNRIFEFGRVINTAISSDEALMFLALFGRERLRDIVARGRCFGQTETIGLQACAGSEQQRYGKRRAARAQARRKIHRQYLCAHAHVPPPARISSEAGLRISMAGPPDENNTPRTRTCLPRRALSSIPAAAKSARAERGIIMVKSSL